VTDDALVAKVAGANGKAIRWVAAVKKPEAAY
jgi:hypothetical protein